MSNTDAITTLKGLYSYAISEMENTLDSDKSRLKYVMWKELSELCRIILTGIRPLDIIRYNQMCLDQLFVYLNLIKVGELADKEISYLAVHKDAARILKERINENNYN